MFSGLDLAIALAPLYLTDDRQAKEWSPEAPRIINAGLWPKRACEECGKHFFARATRRFCQKRCAGRSQERRYGVKRALYQAEYYRKNREKRLQYMREHYRKTCEQQQ